MENTEQKIHKEMTIDEILANFPQKSQKLAHAMQTRGLHCVGCHASTWETLEMGVLGHGMSEDDLEDLIIDLNSILEEQVDPSTVTLTPEAAAKFREILEEEEKQGYGLRFVEKAGGCSGFEYSLDFSKAPLENDVIFNSQGIEIHIPKTIVGRLIGSEIDYVNGLQGAGFKVSNPNVKSSCACGSSHNY